MTGNKIHDERKQFIQKFIPVFDRLYSFISKGNIVPIAVVYFPRKMKVEYQEIIVENAALFIMIILYR